MQFSVKGVLRLFLIGALAVIGILVIGEYVGYDQLSTANAECLDGRVPCENKACVSACWNDGTQHNPHTKATKTTKAPLDCLPGYGCVTQPCN